MNWYKQFLRFAFRNPLDVASISIAKGIFYQIRQLHASGNLRTQSIKYNPAFNDIPKLNLDQIKIRDTAIFNINIHKVGQNIEVQVGGETIGNNIEINITIPNNISEKQFENLYALIFETTRHEIKHFIDFVHGQKTRTFEIEKYKMLIENIRQASAYMLSETEISSFISGILLRAKRWKIPFDKATEQTVDRMFSSFDNNYSNLNRFISQADRNEVEKIKSFTLKTIIEKAQNMYPNLRNIK